jgi:serine protease
MGSLGHRRRTHFDRLALATVIGCLGTTFLAGGGAGAAAAPGSGGAALPNPLSGHPYRHGFVPTVQEARVLQSEGPAANASDVSFGGGIDGVGVTIGTPRVYLVFWGSQWGTQGTNSAGDTTYSGDPDGLAPYLQAFFKGLGTGGETWSGISTQYCQGVATGSQTCPAGSQHVGYPDGGAYAGLWEDTSGAAPAAATANQIAQEAVAAAEHFGNTTTAANRSVQYDIVSPTGIDPDSYESGGFCAWHDYTGDANLDGGGAVSTPWGTPIAFTNMPYVPDVGSNCGSGFVNSGNDLDGVSIVNGHEWNETITDQYPPGGWVNSTGEEIGDLCAWVSSGQGAAQDISLTTGSFAVQSIWANDYDNGAGGCEVSHPIDSGNVITVANPGSQLSFNGKSVKLQIVASDSASGQTLTYSASSLPAGLSLDGSSGLISGIPTINGTASVTITATDTTGASGVATFSWVVEPLGVSVTNPGNQTTLINTGASLQMHAVDSNSGQTLTWSATGLPTGVTINSSSGLISGKATAVATASVTVTATDGLGNKGSTSFTWDVTACGSKQLLGNPGFETGSAAPWTSSPAGIIHANGTGDPSHSGNYFAYFDGPGTAQTDALSQTVTIPAGCKSDTLSYWLRIDGVEFTSTAVDTFKVEAVVSGKTTVLAKYTNLNSDFQYDQYKLNVAKLAGKKIKVTFVGTSKNTNGFTTFALDDTALNVTP